MHNKKVVVSNVELEMLVRKYFVVVQIVVFVHLSTYKICKKIVLNN